MGKKLGSFAQCRLIRVNEKVASFVMLFVETIFTFSFQFIPRDDNANKSETIFDHYYQ
jgi:hypothetical protein